MPATLVLALMTGPVLAQEESPAAQAGTAAKDAPAAALPEWLSMVSLHGMVDTYYAFNSNRPRDQANFVPGTGTTAKRANEFALNLVALDVGVSRGPVGARMMLGFGNGPDVLHAGEPPGVATGPDVLRHVLLASVTWAPDVLPGLVVEAGKFASPIGLETLPSKDNANYTRSWMGEFSPYYLAGVRALWTFREHLTLSGGVVNGWQNVGENNPFKSTMTSVAWNSDVFSASWNTLTGPELAGSEEPWTLLPPVPDGRVRHLSDVVLVWRPARSIQFSLQVDGALQRQGLASWQPWGGAGGYARFAVTPWMAVALRAELFADPSGAIGGTRQVLAGGTATVEFTPAPFFSLKVEARSDQSSAPSFSSAGRAADGSPGRRTGQTLLAVGAVVHF